MDVLIIDDDADVRRTHSRLLERAGFMVRTVENGLAAIAELQQHRFRVIHLDIQMPFLEGERFYDELLKQYPKAAKRVVFVTGYADAPEIQPLLEHAGRPVLRKPVNARELVEVTKRVAALPG
jgi:two-component system C4-dicarboxylate transport response regulator DctD